MTSKGKGHANLSMIGGRIETICVKS